VVLVLLEGDLARRFGNDTRIVAVDAPAAAVARLASLADQVEPGVVSCRMLTR
jgi:hypothetical protein